MYYLKEYILFDTEEKGQEMLKKARELRSKLIGSIYSDCVDADIREIEEKIYQLRYKK